MCVALSLVMIPSQVSYNGEDYLIPKTEYGIDIGKEEVEKLIKPLAEKYNVSSYQMMRTVQCESGFKNIQSNIIKNGIREPSFGLAQIHLPSNPTITKEMALDPNFALEFMAKEFSNGNSWKWYGYIPEKDTCSGNY